MDYSTELKRINDKYYHKIKKEYSKYIKNFDSIPDLTQNVYIIPDNKCIDDYEDLAVGKNRGRCDADTGNIYIRESAFCEHLLVHEFVHRLSRNYDGHQWINGIGCTERVDNFDGLNEMITEWLAFSITKQKEKFNRMQDLFFIIRRFKLLKPLKYHKFISAYFICDLNKIRHSITKSYENGCLDIINNYLFFALDDKKIHNIKF